MFLDGGEQVLVNPDEGRGDPWPMNAAAARAHSTNLVPARHSWSAESARVGVGPGRWGRRMSWPHHCFDVGTCPCTSPLSPLTSPTTTACTPQRFDSPAFVHRRRSCARSPIM